MIKAVGYARVSTSSDSQDSSYENQCNYFEHYCKNNDLELVGVYSDKLSGTDVKDREGFRSMLEQVGVVYEDYGHFSTRPMAELPFTLIICKNSSRFGRNLRITLEVLECLNEQGVTVKFIENGLSSSNNGDMLVLNIMNTLDTEYSKDLSEKIRAGYIMSATTTNKVTSNGKLYGYSYENNKLKIIEEEAQVIRMIYQWYIEGKGLRVIGNELRSKDIKNRNGKYFGKNTLLGILTNSKYCGVNNRLRWQTDGVFKKHAKTPKLRPNAEQYFKDSDDIEPIVSKEQFAKCQEILASKQGDRKGVNRGNTIYSQKIKCGICNASYTSNVDKGRRFYNCSNKAKYGLSKCNNRNISLNKLNELLSSEWLIQSLHSIKLMQNTHLMRLIQELEASKDKSVEDEVEALRCALNTLSDKLNKVLDLYIEGDLDKDTYKGRKVKLEKQINDLKASIEAKCRSNDEIDEIIEQKKRLIKASKEIKIKDNYSREEILDILYKIEVKPNMLYVSLLINNEVMEVLEPIIW